MFDDRAFDSWPLILGGAMVFALLFGVLTLLAEGLFGYTDLWTPTVLGIAGLAFAGYIGVAALIRYGTLPPP